MDGYVYNDSQLRLGKAAIERRLRARGILMLHAIVVILLTAACSGGAPVALLPPTPEPVEAMPAAGETEIEAESSAPETAATDDDAPAATSQPILEPTATPEPVTPIIFDPATVALELQPAAQGLDRPLFITHPGDGSSRLFIVEKAGRIQLLADGQLGAQPFLDITDRVNSSANEQGLLGLAFSPTYVEDGLFFVNYSDSNGDTVVSRFSVSADNPDSALADSERQVLTIAQPASNHNGGMLAFGPDGYLYIGTGDGGAANDRFENGQNPDSLLGKMLRIDVTSDLTQPYQIPADNPWVAMDWNGTDVRDEIWAVGLRNPWRYSFDRATGDLWIADVGQNQYEEVNFVPAAATGPLNFGWPIMEATHCFGAGECDPTGLELPVAEYSHSGHCSVTGGYVYRGSNYPALQGAYLYGDYCSGVIWATARDAAGAWTTTELVDADLQLSSFGEDEAGELYVTDLSSGTVYRLVDANTE